MVASNPHMRDGMPSSTARGSLAPELRHADFGMRGGCRARILAAAIGAAMINLSLYRIRHEFSRRPKRLRRKHRRRQVEA